MTACESPRDDAALEQEGIVADTMVFMSSRIGATLRQTLRSGAEGPIGVLVHVDTTEASDVPEQLRAAGFDIRATTGDIYAATAARQSILQAADLPFVRSIELSETR